LIELSPELSTIAKAPATFDTFLALEGEIFRQIGDRKTLRFVVDSKGYFIKIHAGVGWREIFKNLLQGRLPVLGAKNEVRAIQRLTELGIGTTPLAGYGWRGWNPARQESFVITEELTDTVTLEELSIDWASKPPPLALKRALIRKIAAIAKTLHENGINHRDFYICHFNLQPKTSGKKEFPLYLMDLHRTQIRARTPERWIIKDIAGLHFSSMDCGLTARDRLRFIRAYRGKPLRAILAEEKRFWQRVQKRARKLYDAHYELYKAHYEERKMASSSRSCG
jgi:lipopolysaccharide core heptose(I) kinase